MSESPARLDIVRLLFPSKGLEAGAVGIVSGVFSKNVLVSFAKLSEEFPPGDLEKVTMSEATPEALKTLNRLSRKKA